MTDRPLQLAFCLYSYFPHGGMQRACRRIAARCVAAGAEVTMYVMKWSGPVPEGVRVQRFSARGLFNHTRHERYQVWLEAQLEAQPADCVVGFNRMPGLDVYYAADSCYLEKALTARSALYRRTPDTGTSQPTSVRFLAPTVARASS